MDVIKDTHEFVICDEPEVTYGMSCPRQTIFLWDRDVDLYKDLKVLHWMVKSLGHELRYNDLSEFKWTFGTRKVRLKLYCSRFTVRTTSTRLNSSEMSDVPFACTNMETQMYFGGGAALRTNKISFAEYETQEMEPLTMDGVDVYEADTVPWLPPEPLNQSMVMMDSPDSEPVAATSFTVVAEIHQAQDSEPEAQLMEVCGEISKLSSSDSEPILKAFPRLKSESFSFTDNFYAQDPCARFDTDSDPDRYTAFVPSDFIPRNQPDYNFANIKESPDDVIEVKQPLEPVISISSESSLSDKRAMSPNLFDDDVIFVPNPEPVKPRTPPPSPPPKTPDSTESPPHFVDFDFLNQQLFSNSKHESVFEITKNEIFSNFIKAKANGELTPVVEPASTSRRRSPSPPTSTFNPVVSDDEDEMVPSSQPWFSFRTPKRRTTPCKTRGSSKSRPAATSGGWLNKFMDVSPTVPSPKTPVSRKRLFGADGKKAPPVNSPEDLFI